MLVEFGVRVAAVGCRARRFMRDRARTPWVTEQTRSEGTSAVQSGAILKVFALYPIQENLPGWR